MDLFLFSGYSGPGCGMYGDPRLEICDLGLGPEDGELDN